ncbi:unnamed protein product, partial [Gadus morhua 'NCC']
VAAAPPTVGLPARAPAQTRVEPRGVSVEETPCGEATLAPEPEKKKRRKTTTTKGDVEQPATPAPARAETRLAEGWRTALTGEEQELNSRTLSLWCVHPDAAREGEGCVDSRRCSRRRTTTGGGRGDSAGPGLGSGGGSSGGSSDGDVRRCLKPGDASGSEGAAVAPAAGPGCGSTGARSAGAQTATGASTARPLGCLPGLPADGCCRSCNWTFKSSTASPCGPLTAPAVCVGAPRPRPDAPLGHCRLHTSSLRRWP